jgi:superfamily I DNA and RNA helicase
MIKIFDGYTDKPLAYQELNGFMLEHKEISGCLYAGYPLIYFPGLPKLSKIDCLLISPEKGLVAFNLIEEETVPDDYATKQEDVCQIIEWNLKCFGKLLKKRKLMVDVNVITFAPNVETDLPSEEGYPLCNGQTLSAALADIAFSNPELCDEISKAVRTVGKPVKMIERRPLKPGSKGVYCSELEKKSTLVLDHSQLWAVLEIIDGVQRIRGLSGSGKSTVLALKVAYIHACHPDWKIGVTFNTLSARDQYRNAIDLFYRNHTGSFPNWDNITICHSWGYEDGKNETAGMYQIFTDINNIKFYDYAKAKAYLGMTDPFGEACERGIHDTDSGRKEIFDIIVADEAQDFPPSFLRMCYTMLRDPKRIAFAYDEMQNFRLQPLPPPEEIFGNGDNGMPVASLYQDSADIVLDGCYERPPAIMSAALALAFGIYREPEKGETGLVQMFESIDMWNELGYEVLDGCLDYGKHVVIGKPPEERDIDIEGQIVFKSLKTEEEHDDWVAQEIKRNLAEDGLQTRDIIVVIPELMLLTAGTDGIRRKLRDAGISSHLVGKDNPENEFWNGDSVPFCSLYKARSNEAPMVYAIHAHTSFYSKFSVARTRNLLYSAMTRSKAWVRAVGFGKEMDSLAEEYERIKSKGFKFDFCYPERYNNLHVAFRESREEPILSDPLYLLEMMPKTLEMIRLGKIVLDEDQFNMLREWVERKEKYYYEPRGISGANGEDALAQAKKGE